MAGSLIDTLFQTVAAPRTAEPARSVESRGGEFKPVLDEALTAAPAPTGRAQSQFEDDDAVDAGDLAANDDVVQQAADGAAPESACTDCSLPRDSDEEASNADGEDDAVAQGKATPDDGEAEEHAGDAVDISLAAAAAAAGNSARADIVTTTAPVEETDNVGEVLADAVGADHENSDGDATAKHASEAGDASTADVEVAELQGAVTTEVGDAAPEPGSIDPNIDGARSDARAVSGQAVVKAKDVPQAKTKGGTATPRAEDAAPAPAATSGPNEGPVPHAAVGEDPVSPTAAVEKAIADGEGDAKSPETTRERHPGPTSQTNATSQLDAPEAVAASAPTPASAASPTTSDASSGAPPIAAVTAPTTKTNENGAVGRNATAMARLSAERSLHASGGQGDDVDTARFLGRVEGAVRAAHQREGRVQVRLSPPELGALRIELTLQSGVLSARLEAETPAARNLLLDNLPALRDRLAQQDIRIDQFDVDVRRDGGGSAGGNANQNDAGDRPAHESNLRQQQQRQDRGGPALARRAAPTPRDETTSDTALDVRV